mmetsp:Transcript_8692/g.20104  ORF Transcript_8692/g.20104 Transcript_8692/m.20104 type:complete len:184 (+) Transcript_8692:256-807(+)
MTCLAWSWDHAHLACCSEKGTTHVFAMEQEQSSSSIWKRVLSTDQPKSISQIRGVPHPRACAFLPDLPNSLAVVGYDADGNGVLLISDFTTEEATRVAYHVLVKSHADEAITSTTRRKRLLSTPPSVTQEEGKLYVGERVEVLENQMKEISFEEQDEGFLQVKGFETSGNKEEPPALEATTTQ